jgi:DNA-binding response OmpR family regulator
MSLRQAEGLGEGVAAAAKHPKMTAREWTWHQGQEMQKTILIVDFEPESCEELQQILQSEDFLVLTAADGNQALAMFDAARPDLVLTEALLPKLNGFELCKQITNRELREVRPVIMYSAIYKGEKYQKEAVSGCGALEFLEKPIPKWQLLKAVRNALAAVPQRKAEAANIASSESGAALVVEPAAIVAARDAGDLLEVDFLFDARQAAAGTPTETIVLETPVAESRQSLMPSVDGREIDAALDSVRLDLLQEAEQRDALLARQFEQQLQQEGHTILEFEATLAGGPGAPAAAAREGGDQEFELEVFPHIPAEAPVSADEIAANSAAPNFLIKTTPSGNWLAVLIPVLLALLAVAYFWLRR